MLNAVKEYIKEKLPGMDVGSGDNEESNYRRQHEERYRKYREEEEERYRRYEEQARERERQKKERVELVKKLESQIQNNNQGFGFKVCDMERLKRFIILGSEFNTYYCSPKQILMESVQCVMKLINDGHYQEVLDTIEQYSKQGRAAKDEPLLTVLAICACNERMEVKQAAYEKVNSICNIPTKLFKFIDLTHEDIVRKRISNPPEPQPFTSTRKRKHCSPELGISELTINEEDKEPSENVDDTQTPAKKKKKEKAFKKVNKAAAKSLGWGRMRRNGIAKYYTDGKKDACRLLYLVTKYKQRHNWNHKQVLQYAHPKMSGEDRDAKNLVLKYCTGGYEKVAEEMKELSGKAGVSEKMSEVVAYIEVINAVTSLNPDTDGDEEKLIEHLEKYGQRSQAKEFTTQHSVEGSETKENKFERKSPIQIVREHIPNGFLGKSKKVWELMLLDMPMTAMIRNLGKMSSLEMFEDNPKNTNIVLSALDNEKRLQSARVHPVKLLIAAQTYERGSGEKGSLKWKVNQDIIKSLNAAFYKSFKSPEMGKTFRTNKKYLLALDVSGSMQGGGCLGCESLSPAMATAAMAMVTWNIEDDVEIMGFGGTFMDLKPLMEKSMTVQEAMKAVGKLNFGTTDCSLPMIFALTEKKEVDVFIVYTDSETCYDTWQPMDALKLYNIEMKRDAKLIVCAMTSAGFSIADPNNPNALDICGFDANVPEIINNFVTGNEDVKCCVCDDCKKPPEPMNV